jgi:oligopeptide/dipeptide ABC transporter ATP-binding protein
VSDDTLLHVRNLSVRYPGASGPAVDGISFDVPQCGSVAIVGESGSGKSTTVLAAMRLLDPSAAVTADSVAFGGSELLALPRRQLRDLRRSQLAMVFQDPTASWNPTRTIRTQLLDGLRGDARAARRAKLIEYMRRVGIRDPEDRLDDHPHHFSGGMLQRAMLAGVLAHGPTLLVADEPTSALDSTVQAELLALIAQLRAEEGLALLMISHDLGVVARVATETIVLYGGRVMERGPTRSILRDPLHPYTRDLLAATPRLHGPRKVPLVVGRPGEIAQGGCRYRNRCVFAIERCASEQPALRVLDGVEVACHCAPLPVPDAA